MRSDPSRTSILVAEDDPSIRLSFGVRLRRDGYDVHEATSGDEALHLVGGHDIDLVVLDIGLPGLSGLDVLTRMREELQLHVPVLVVTGHDHEDDKIRGLDLGADDYLGKPVSPRELAARVRALLRRSSNGGASNGHAALTFRDGLLRIEPATRDTYLNGELVDLTTKEFDLLLRLARTPRQVLTREQLLNDVWDSSSRWQDPATVTEHVRRLRLKLDTDDHAWFGTVRGVGYRFEP